MNISISEQVAPDDLNYQLDDLIVPAWVSGDGGISPEIFTLDARAYTDATLKARMQEVYDQFGIVRITGRQDGQLEAMKLLAATVLPGGMDYEAGANPRDVITENVFEVGAPLTAWLHYHHEMAYVAESTRALAFLCRHAATAKGETCFSDNLHATDLILQTALGEKLKDLGVCYHRNLTNRERFDDALPVGVYNHWQKSFGTESPGEAEQLAQDKGLETHWRDDMLCTRYYADAFEYFPALNRNLLFSSIADHGMWFDGWPLVMHLPYEARPLHMTFGDDSEFSREELQTFVDIYDAAGFRVDWQPGDVVVFCNYRFAHGRPGIHLLEGEKRELGVMLGETLRRRGQINTAW